MRYILQLEDYVYYSEGPGVQNRTMKREKAKIFDSIEDAKKALEKAEEIKKYHFYKILKL